MNSSFENQALPPAPPRAELVKAFPINPAQVAMGLLLIALGIVIGSLAQGHSVRNPDCEIYTSAGDYVGTVCNLQAP